MKILLSKKIGMYLLSSIMVMALFLPLGASAGEIRRTNEGAAFNNAWQRHYTSGSATITYGFNTTLINEDYTWANHSTAQHWGYVNNANGTHLGPNKPGGSVSKIEVRHAGTTINYACQW